jgi:hypothetical protein
VRRVAVPHDHQNHWGLERHGPHRTGDNNRCRPGRREPLLPRRPPAGDPSPAAALVGDGGDRGLLVAARGVRVAGGRRDDVDVVVCEGGNGCADGVDRGRGWDVGEHRGRTHDQLDAELPQSDGYGANVRITDPISGNQSYVPGSLQTPPGWSGEWSTDGGASYVATEPASGVNAVGASGVSVDGSTGARVPANPPTSVFVPSTSPGDGWEPLFIGPTNVYNLHHHRQAGSSQTVIDCHDKLTGAECPGYPASYVSQTAGAPLGTGGDTLDTSSQAFALVDQADGHIYFPAGVAGDSTVGVACSDVFTYSSCGFIALGDGGLDNSDSPQDPSRAELVQISGGAVIGAKLYMITSVALDPHNPGVTIWCFDSGTVSACPGYPIVVDPTYTVADLDPLATARADLQTWGGRYVFGTVLRTGTGQRDLLCIDTTTNTDRPAYPVLGYTNVPALQQLYGAQVLAPDLDSSGTLIAVCAETVSDGTSAPFTCFSLTGASLGPAPWGQMVDGDDLGYHEEGSPLLIGTRLYLAYNHETTGAATYACWDFSTGAPCAGVWAGQLAKLRAALPEFRSSFDVIGAKTRL